MEQLLLHLAVDKIGVPFKWTDDICEHSVVLPLFMRNAWEMYAVVIEAWFWMMMLANAREE